MLFDIGGIARRGGDTGTVFGNETGLPEVIPGVVPGAPRPATEVATTSAHKGLVRWNGMSES